MRKGLFIVFEGPDGSGKTTIMNEVGEYLKQNKIPFVSTREPGGIGISEQIREVILNKNNTKMDGRTEALLYAASRRQHLVEKVIPALKDGKIVLCDRFVLSSLAYQGYARGLGIDEVLDINKFAIEEYMPDINILFDLEPEIGLKRIEKNHKREVNRLDLEALEFHEKVREGYLLLEKQFENKVIKVDASKSINEVKKDVLLIINGIIDKNKHIF